MANKYGDWINYLSPSLRNFLQGGVPSTTASWQNKFTPTTGVTFNPTSATPPAPQLVATAQPTTPVNNNAYNPYNGLLKLKVDSNLPSDQDVLDDYNAWRKANPNAAGQDWKMELANGVTLTEQNVNNILNPYGVGRPESVPDYVPTYVPEEVMNRNLLAMRQPTWSEAQYQQALNSLEPYYDYKNNIIPALMSWNRNGR